MKTCSKCKKKKELIEFNKSNKAKDGLQSHCNMCRKEAYRKKRGPKTKRKRASNFKDLTGKVYGKLTVLSYSGVDETKNVKWICQCSCAEQTIKTIQGAALRKGKTQSCGCLRTERMLTINQKEAGRYSWNTRIRRYKNEAKNRGREFSITSEQFKEISSKDCFYCASPPKDYNAEQNKKNSFLTEEGKKRQWIKVNGIDRIDSKKGYTLDNIRPCCAICNTMKLALSEKDFYIHIETIYVNLVLKQLIIKET